MTLEGAPGESTNCKAGFYVFRDGIPKRVIYLTLCDGRRKLVTVSDNVYLFYLHKDLMRIL